MKVTKVFHDGKLVSLKQEPLDKPIKQSKALRLLAHARALQKDSLYSFEELEREVCKLRRALITSERLAKARTKERDAVRDAHRKRLKQIEDLLYKLDDLTFQVEALQEEKQELENAISAIGRSNVSRAAAAKPVKSSG